VGEIEIVEHWSYVRGTGRDGMGWAHYERFWRALGS
jgi:hypothetical protein